MRREEITLGDDTIVGRLDLGVSDQDIRGGPLRFGHVDVGLGLGQVGLGLLHPCRGREQLGLRVEHGLPRRQFGGFGRLVILFFLVGDLLRDRLVLDELLVAVELLAVIAPHGDIAVDLRRRLFHGAGRGVAVCLGRLDEGLRLRDRGLGLFDIGRGLLRLGDDFRIVDVGENLITLDPVTVVDVQDLQVSRDLGVQIGLLEGLDGADLGRDSLDPAFGQADRLDRDRLVGTLSRFRGPEFLGGSGRGPGPSDVVNVPARHGTAEEEHGEEDQSTPSSAFFRDVLGLLRESIRCSGHDRRPPACVGLRLGLGHLGLIRRSSLRSGMANDPGTGPFHSS